MKKKRNVVEMAMSHHRIVILLVCCLVFMGIFSLSKMRKNEFPDFTIRQGVVAVVAPGNTAEEMEQQVVKPLENYIFTYKEVKKAKTYSMSRDGIAYIMVQLNDELTNADDFWSKFKHGVQSFKGSLPENVLAVVVNDDFGDTSALLVALDSDQKTYRELSDYMDNLQDRLRTIESVGRLTVSGMRDEQISVTIDNDKLAHYGLTDQMIAMQLMQKGFTFTGGRVKGSGYTMPVHVAKSLNSVYDIEQQVVYSSPAGQVVRLKDIATVKREYPQPTSLIKNNGKKCLLLSVEMKKGKNIVKMGDDINKELAAFQKELPADVSVYRITDQSKVVDDSVVNFLKELLIAIVAVAVVVILLLPLRVALVASSTIPITIFISLGLYYAFDIELNTVTLAALIVTLGMIVDNSIVIIDNYLEQIGEGRPRWEAAVSSTTHFFRSIFSATLAISLTFFPFLLTCTGQTHDFLVSFPWAISIVLGISLAVAALLVPFMQYFFIKKPTAKADGETKKHKFSFLNALQRGYERMLDWCMAWPKTTLAIGVASVAVGGVMMVNMPQQMMPFADRNQFAVEIYLPTGTTLNKTQQVADSLEHILDKDKRVASIASFIGCASPRFHTAYAPQIAGENYAQFIVNTVSNDATKEIISEYSDKYANYFPEAMVKFKRLSYNESNCPIEVRLSDTDRTALMADAEKIKELMHEMPELMLVRTNFNEPQPTTTVRLREEEAARLGISNLAVETTLAMRYGDGVSMASVWEGDKEVPVTLKSTCADSTTVGRLADEQMPVMGGLKTVPLRQVADVVPTTQYGQLVRRNGVPTITIMADLKGGQNALSVTQKLQKKIDEAGLNGKAMRSKLVYGGDFENGQDMQSQTMGGLAVAAVLIFFILLSHFRKISLSLLIFASMALSMFGTAVGLKVMGVAFSVTSILGIVSLMGIIVRNGIIMFDYAEELRYNEQMPANEAIRHSASRRMRPIFLTSAAASMGVIPMVLGGSGLWQPMGTVICFGTLISMVFILTVIPASYLLAFGRKKATNNQQQADANINE